MLTSAAANGGNADPDLDPDDAPAPVPAPDAEGGAESAHGRAVPAGPTVIGLVEEWRG